MDDREWWGFEVSAATEIPTPTVYGILARLERADWVVAQFECVDPSVEGRPARRLYRLTREGSTEGAQQVAEWRRRRRISTRALRELPT